MTELQAKFVSAFVPTRMRRALEQIEAQRAVFSELLQQPNVVESLKGLGVSVHPAAGGENSFMLVSPVGEIKVKFVSQLEGDHLGIAAVFSYVNEKNQDFNFFVLRMNSQTPWMDSTGELLEMEFHTDNPTTSAFAIMLRRVLAMRLQILETSLTGI